MTINGYITIWCSLIGACFHSVVETKYLSGVNVRLVLQQSEEGAGTCTCGCDAVPIFYQQLLFELGIVFTQDVYGSPVPCRASSGLTASPLAQSLSYIARF